MDVSVFECRDMHRLDALEHVGHLFTLPSDHANYIVKTVCFALLRFRSQISDDIDGFGLEAMAEDGLVQILVPRHDGHQFIYQRPFEVQCGTSRCAEALLVLDTDGGRLAVKYNSLARKDGIL